MTQVAVKVITAKNGFYVGLALSMAAAPPRLSLDKTNSALNGTFDIGQGVLGASSVSRYRCTFAIVTIEIVVMAIIALKGSISLTWCTRYVRL